MNEPAQSWAGLLGGNDRRGGSSAARASRPQELVWRVSLPDAIRSSPVFHNGLLFVTCRDGRLYALALADGRQLWRSASLRQITAPPLAAPASVLVQSFTGAAKAYDLDTGAELWTASLGGSLQSTPAVTDDYIFLATHPGVVYAVR